MRALPLDFLKQGSHKAKRIHMFVELVNDFCTQIGSRMRPERA